MKHADPPNLHWAQFTFWCHFLGGDTEAGGTGRSPPAQDCYPCYMFNFGKPKTAGDWIVHIAGAIIAIFLVWWMLRMYVL
jgi:hypothetical protein